MVKVLSLFPKSTNIKMHNPILKFKRVFKDNALKSSDLNTIKIIKTM